MNEGLTIFLVVAGYFVAGFTLLGICALIVNHTYPQSKYNNQVNRQDNITTNKFNKAA